LNGTSDIEAVGESLASLNPPLWHVYWRTPTIEIHQNGLLGDDKLAISPHEGPQKSRGKADPEPCHSQQRVQVPKMGAIGDCKTL
jgi:hypothetical protein